jgi:transcription antitermination factor NusA-like protein
MREGTDSVSIVGKAAARAAARALLEKEFEMEEETQAMECEYPLLMVRLIIGIGGANVRRLEQESGARIRFDFEGDNRDPSARADLHVRGTGEARRRALELIRELQAELGFERMAVPLQKHFVLIGRGGEAVKQLESQTNTAICFTQEPEGMVVMGRAEDRREAMQLAQQRLDGVLGADQEVVSVPRHLRAEVIGAGGRNIQSIERRSGAMVHLKGGKHAGAHAPCLERSSPVAVASARVSS